MVQTYSKQNGFVLIVALGFLAVMTVLVLTTMVGTIQSEKMSGSQMERNRAFQAAERALRNAETILRKYGDECVSSPFCLASKPVGVGFGESLTEATLKTQLEKGFPDSDANVVKKEATGTAKETETSYAYLINHVAMVPEGKKSSCIPYSIIAKGQGAGEKATVVLQSVVFLCPSA